MKDELVFFPEKIHELFYQWALPAALLLRFVAGPFDVKIFHGPADLGKTPLVKKEFLCQDLVGPQEIVDGVPVEGEPRALPNFFRWDS